MNSHSERSISTEPSSPTSGLLERALEFGGGAEVELAADGDDADAVLELGGGYLEWGRIHALDATAGIDRCARALGLPPGARGKN